MIGNTLKKYAAGASKWLVPTDLLFRKAGPHEHPQDDDMRTDLCKQLDNSGYHVDPGYGYGKFDLCLIQLKKDLD